MALLVIAGLLPAAGLVVAAGVKGMDTAVQSTITPPVGCSRGEGRHGRCPEGLLPWLPAEGLAGAPRQLQSGGGFLCCEAVALRPDSLFVLLAKTMLRFCSADVRAVNPRRAAEELIETAFGSTSPEGGLLLVNATVGHQLDRLSQELTVCCPGARVLASSCAGTIGGEGPGESLHHIALMGIQGEGLVVSHVDGLLGSTSYSKGVELARGLLEAPAPIHSVYLLASGIDIANDQLLAGLEAVLGPDVVIFGATSSDQMQGVATYQAVDGRLFQHAAFAVGFWDPSLKLETQATHGFVAVGEPRFVTRAEGNRILELDGQPAWPAYLEWLGLPADATEASSIPIGALAEELPDALAEVYGNRHILRVVTHHDSDGALFYATSCAVGTRLWLTLRDEERIFRDLDRMMTQLVTRSGGAEPVAVLHADCLARGRRLFNRVMKDELVHRMQDPLRHAGALPPWLGMYGFGEYARLSGRNAYHNYTTALGIFYRA